MCVYVCVCVCVCVYVCVTYVLSNLILFNTIIVVDYLRLPNLPSYTPTLMSLLLYANTDPAP